MVKQQFCFLNKSQESGRSLFTLSLFSPTTPCSGVGGAADYRLPLPGMPQITISSQGAVYSSYTMPGFASCAEAMNL